MKIIKVIPQSNYILKIVADDGREGEFDVKPYMEYEAFSGLRDKESFTRVTNGGYYIEWDCGADLSADTIEAKWKIAVSKESSCVAEDISIYGAEKKTKAKNK